MKVKHLIELLQQYNPELPVCIDNFVSGEVDIFTGYSDLIGEDKNSYFVLLRTQKDIS